MVPRPMAGITKEQAFHMSIYCSMYTPCSYCSYCAIGEEACNMWVHCSKISLPQPAPLGDGHASLLSAPNGLATNWHALGRALNCCSNCP